MTKRTLKERIGVDKKNPYHKSNAWFWVIMPIIALVITSILIWAINDYYADTQKCKLNGYIALGNQEVEPGYILCCRYELVNHIKEVKCDTIKE